MRGTVVLSAAALLLVTRAAHPAGEAVSLGNAERWGKPLEITQPAYPEEALKMNKGAVVDLVARVAGNGALQDLELRASPEDDAFVAAIRAVVGLWRFYPPVGDDCLPSASRIRSQVAFEVDGGKPRIFVQRPTMPVQHPKTPLVPLKRNAPEYPPSMVTANRAALVFGRAEIGPQGDVTAVATTAFPRESPEDLLDFEKSTRAAASRWTFAPEDEGLAGERSYCFEVVFKPHE